MNTFMHEKAQFASSQKGSPVCLAHALADITALVSLGIRFLQCLHRKALGILLSCWKATSSAAFGIHFGFWTLCYPGSQQVILAKQKCLFHSVSGPNFP